MTVEQNVLVRKAAMEFVELGESLCSDGQHDARKFWIAVAAMAVDRAGLTHDEVPPRKHPPRMNEQEAKSFGNRKISFGKHEGTKIDDVPLDYLDWLAESENTRFTLDLVRYVASERVRRER